VAVAVVAVAVVGVAVVVVAKSAPISLHYPLLSHIPTFS
jgi:hypothetical protein